MIARSCCHALPVIARQLLPRPARGSRRPDAATPWRWIGCPDAGRLLPVIARPDAAHALPVIARPDAAHALPVIGCQLLAIRSAPCRAALRRHAATLRCAPAPRLPM